MENKADEVFDSGDGDVSLEELFSRNADGLWRFFLLRCGNQAEADDLMQELCLQMVRSKSKLLEVDSHDGWLFGVAKNVLRNHIRGKVRRRNNIPTVSPEKVGELTKQIDTGELPSDAMESSETNNTLLMAVTALSGKDQEIIRLHYFEGLSFKDIAQKLEITPRSVEGRLYRARKELRGKLGDLEI